MKAFFTLLLVVGLITNSFSQITEAEPKLIKQTKDSLDGWKTGGIISINVTQVSLTNWSAGGDNSLSVTGILSLFANLKKGKSSWDNSLDLAYGVLQQNYDAVRKTDDKIDFTSKYGRKASKNWYYAGLINFKSQMTAGYKYPDDSTEISNWMAPGYLLGAIGMDFKPSDVFTMFVSPVTMKITFVNDQNLADAGAYGVEAAEYNDLGVLTKNGQNIRSEYGGYLRAVVKKELMENVKLQSKIELFSNYSEEPSNIDVNLELLLAMKVNKIITATISTQLVYDDDVNIAVDTNSDDIPDEFGPRVQFKEVLGIGISIKF